jgi:oxaloacetate decarboxylase gamma subunit
MEVDLVSEGLKFMIIGMSVVFGFLTMLVGVLQVQSRVLTKFFPQKPVEPKKKAAPKSDDNVIAAIALAVHKYKN